MKSVHYMVKELKNKSSLRIFVIQTLQKLEEILNFAEILNLRETFTKLHILL